METDETIHYALYGKIYGEQTILGLFCEKNYLYHEHLEEIISTLRFRLNGKVVMISVIWPKQISQAEYETYLEFDVCEELKFGQYYDLDSGIKMIIPPIKFVDK
jgi:hypothetical protein